MCANPGQITTSHSPERWMLFCALGEPHQPAAAGLPLDHNDRALDVLATLVDGVGPEPVLPLVLDTLDDEYLGADHFRVLVEVLAGLPLDAAFRALVDRIGDPAVPPALLAAADRFPRARALLAESDAPRAAELLAGHVRSNPALTGRTLPDLPAKARETVQGILAANTHAPDAADLPPLLAAPPWTRRARRPGRSSSRTCPHPASARSRGNRTSARSGCRAAIRCGGGRTGSTSASWPRSSTGSPRTSRSSLSSEATSTSCVPSSRAGNRRSRGVRTTGRGCWSHASERTRTTSR
ncbi:hypothetical protein [Actinomadura sp. CNU-125]|uniref:hypothetical protein n=1 Tax=Actinomadura sp. CNU-125 TaxID=1904961 RepID=UPI0011779E9A|nr:hypothetical protein [Actinomadura sp. CNU-125]